VLGAASGLSKGYIRKGPISVAESGLDRKVLTGKTVWLEDAQTAKAFQYGAMAKAEGIKSVLVVPLMLEKKAIGVLRVYAERVRRFGDDELKFLRWWRTSVRSPWTMPACTKRSGRGAI